LIGQLREYAKKLTEPLAVPLASAGLHPNLVSFIAIPLALIAAYFIVTQNYSLAFVFAVLAILMDFIDGTVARMLKQTSYFGNYFETMVDKIVEVILLTPFVLFYPLATALAIGFSLIASYAKPRAALVIISDNRDWPAIGEHAERQLIFLAGLLVTVFIPSIAGIPVMLAALYLIFFATLVGTVQRILYAKKLIEEAKRNGNILPYLKKGFERKEE